MPDINDEIKELAARVAKLEELIGNAPDVVETIKALSQGTFKGTSDLLSEVASCKHEHDKEVEQLKQKLNEVITWIKTLHQE